MLFCAVSEQEKCACTLLNLLPSPNTLRVRELLATLIIRQPQKRTFTETRSRASEKVLASRTLKKPEYFILRGLILAIETSVICRLQAAEMDILRAAVGYKGKREDTAEELEWGQ
jgi:hypothetical protein